MQVNMPDDIFELDHFRKIHFGKLEKRLTLSKGDLLLEYGKANDCLFIILSGSVSGYVIDDDGRKTEVFRSGKDMFVGVRSFFSRELLSYADVIANEETELAYVDINELSQEQRHNLVSDFVPVLINELYVRQRHSSTVIQENEAALKKLMKADNMATLGQLAAGITHELNNAIGVLQSSAQWLSEESAKYLSEREGDEIMKIFQEGLKKGYTISSADARKARSDLEKKFGLKTLTAKNFAKTGINATYLKGYKPEEIEARAGHLFRIWQLGVSLHDISLASRHAGHVIRSVKQLAVTNYDRQVIQINQTITQSLTLLRSVVRRVEVITNYGDLPEIEANQGELVQIWVNIIKNGCESMLHDKTESPCLEIETYKKGQKIIVKISDNGPGISKDNLKKIFQPSFTTKKEGLSFGLGLGLSVVANLVESYNGKIEANSKKEKTTFIITLPIQ